MSIEQQFEVNITRWIQFVKSDDFIQHVPAKKATPEIVSALKLFQELFPFSKQQAVADLFISEMEKAAAATWTDKMQTLPPVLGKTCEQIVVQWSSKYLLAFISDVFKEKEAILPPDAKLEITEHFFTPTEDIGDEHIQAKLTAWFWQFIADNHVNKKGITVAQLKLCCKAFGNNTTQGNYLLSHLFFLC